MVLNSQYINDSYKGDKYMNIRRVRLDNGCKDNFCFSLRFQDRHNIYDYDYCLYLTWSDV